LRLIPPGGNQDDDPGYIHTWLWESAQHPPQNKCSSDHKAALRKWLQIDPSSVAASVQKVPADDPSNDPTLDKADPCFPIENPLPANPSWHCDQTTHNGTAIRSPGRSTDKPQTPEVIAPNWCPRGKFPI